MNGSISISSHHHHHQQQLQAQAPQGEEEYTDYSCSTALERLSRDVETVLRTWHVDKGCDRHVSVGMGIESSTATTTAGSGGSDHNNTSSFMNTTTTPLIRSNTISWHIPVTTKQGRTTVTVDLELALWDAPTGNSGSGGDNTLANYNDDYYEDDEFYLRQGHRHRRRPMVETSTSTCPQDQESSAELSPLVKSLQQRQLNNNNNNGSGGGGILIMPTHDGLFDNFAQLFGIGQHISLSLIGGTGGSGANDDDDGSGMNNNQWMNMNMNMDPDLVEFLATNQLQRHAIGLTPLHLSATLSSWLQTALNIATCNCTCAIPAIGVWGVYRPNHNHNHNYHHIAAAGAGGGAGTSTTWSVPSGNNNNSNGGTPGVPSSSDYYLLGTTIQTKEDMETMRMMMMTTMNGNAPSSPSPPSPSPPQGIPVFPQWAQAFINTNTNTQNQSKKQPRLSLPPVSSAYQRRAQHSFWNTQFVPPLVCGQVQGFEFRRDIPTTSATMWISGMTTNTTSSTSTTSIGNNKNKNNNSNPHHATTTTTTHISPQHYPLATWARVLLQHTEDTSCLLVGARHVFGWFKSKDKGNKSKSKNGEEEQEEWREMPITASASSSSSSAAAAAASSSSSFAAYQRNCQIQARNLLQDAWENNTTAWSTSAARNDGYSHSHSSSDNYNYNYNNSNRGRPPVWGPLDDPVASVYATTTWNGSTHSTTSTSTGSTGSGSVVVEPLWVFPSRITSFNNKSGSKSGSNTSNKKDYMEMERAVEQTILDPLQNPSRFVVQVYFDRDTSVTRLAAHQKCLLAALIRSATLPGETLLHHLTDAQLVSLWDEEAGNLVAQKLATSAHVGSATQQIVQAMDWASGMEEIMTIEQAERRIHPLLNGHAISFESPPENDNDDDGNGHRSSSSSDNDQVLSLLCRPFTKAAPLGRLVSLLFAQLASVQTLSNMSLLWQVFCQEIRRKWQARESLPNMSTLVPGLDGAHDHLDNTHRAAAMAMAAVAAGHSSTGNHHNHHKSPEGAAFWHGQEPDPDQYHCLIGQKLQTFQVGVECIVARELLEQEVMQAFLEQGQVPSSCNNNSNNSNNVTGKGDKKPPGLEEEETDHRWRPVGSDKLMASLEKEPGEILSSSAGEPPKIILEPPSNSSSHNKKKKTKKSSSMESTNTNTINSVTGEKKDYGPPAINSDLEFWVMDQPGYAPRDVARVTQQVPTADDTGFDFVVAAPLDLEDVDADMDSVDAYSSRRRSTNTTTNNGWEGTIMQDNGSQQDNDEDDDDDDDDASDASHTTNGSLSQAYFDAAEAGSIFSTKHGFVTLDTVVNVADMKRRPGARCPVHKVTLGTGDQLYAPYLQRPCPLTDDLVMERKHMLASEQREGESRKAVLQARIELAHRLQRPKLLSDMSAFKSANPNATIDDFTKWYGNPGSPLDEYDDDVPLPEDASLSGAYYASAAKKLDRASEAMKVLMATRDFWATTWEQAPAVPAAEQEPLFDFESTVEMAIDYLEQMHPANLVNQVMAVNLSSAYFVLVSSADEALKVGLVKTTIQKLREKVDRALQLLSDDATGALFQQQANNNNSSDNGSTATATANQYISEESIFACEDACNSLSVTETMLSRAISLLSKFPHQYTLVQDLLKLTDGTTVALTDPLGRKGFLNVIYQQQRNHPTFLGAAASGGISDSTPQPVLREYILRNLDDEKPCQLAVRLGDSDAYLGRVENEGGVLLAILKSYTE